MAQIEFDFGMAVASDYDEDGHLQVGIDLPGGADDGGAGGGAPSEVLAPFGFLSRPLDPVKDAAGTISVGCGMLWLRNGDQRHCFLLEDPRIIALLPKLKKGGSIVFCADGNFLLFDGEDPTGKTRPGSLTGSVKYRNSKDETRAHVLAMDKRTAGKEQLSLLHGEGQGLMCMATGKRPAVLRNAKGTAWLETNDDGNVLAGKTKAQGSLTVGEQAAAMPVASGPIVASLFAALSQTLIGMGAAAGLTAPASGAVAAAFAAQSAGLLAKLQTLHLKAT
jgi:hypothetical protein